MLAGNFREILTHELRRTPFRRSSQSPNANDHRGVIGDSSSTAATKPFLECQRARGRNFPWSTVIVAPQVATGP